MRCNARIWTPAGRAGAGGGAVLCVGATGAALLIAGAVGVVMTAVAAVVGG